MTVTRSPEREGTERRIREHALDGLAVAGLSLGASVAATAMIWVLAWCLS